MTPKDLCTDSPGYPAVLSWSVFPVSDGSSTKYTRNGHVPSRAEILEDAAREWSEQTFRRFDVLTF